MNLRSVRMKAGERPFMPAGRTEPEFGPVFVARGTDRLALNRITVRQRPRSAVASRAFPVSVALQVAGPADPRALFPSGAERERAWAFATVVAFPLRDHLRSHGTPRGCQRTFPKTLNPVLSKGTVAKSRRLSRCLASHA